MANISKPTTLNTIWASTGTRIDPGITKTNIGWVVQLPPYEYQNWAMNRQDTAIAHFNQHGVPEWDVVTEYQGNLSYTQGSNGFIYKCLQTHTGLDPTNTNNNLYWRLAFEEYGSVQVVQSSLNAHLTDYATLSGIANVVAARANLSVYSKAEGDTRYAYKGGDNATPFLVGTATNAQHAVPLSQINSLLVPATESSYGTTQYATTGETEAGTIDNKSITPLKASTILLKKSGNLAGLTNVATARSNLGLSDIATMSSNLFLARGNNLSDLGSAVTARTNLGLGSAALSASTEFSWRANNLSDLTNISTARNNLGLTALATTDPNSILTKAGNLAGLTNTATARGNLGLGSAATASTGDFLLRGNNLYDLPNVQAARNALQLGSAATMNAIGTTGSLDFSASGGYNGWMQHPNGLIEQWGMFDMGGGASQQRVNFPRSFPGASWNITMTRFELASNESGMPTVKSMDAGGFVFHHAGSNTYTAYMWRAIGA